MLKNKIFYKYKRIDTYTKDSLKNKYFYYSRQEQLDDPFDMYTPVENLKTDAEIREYFKRNPEIASMYTVKSFKRKQAASEFDEEYKKKYVEVSQMFHVLSLTPINDNDAMWALYADNYKGIAIGYRAIDELNGNYSISLGVKREINNQRKFLLEQGPERFYENPDLRIRLRPVEYDISKLKPFNMLCTNPYEMLENIYIKKPIWSFEKEYRSMIISPRHRYEHLKIYYPDEVLSEIIFGFNVSDDIIKDVKNLVSNNYSNRKSIKFLKVIPNRNQFKLNIIQIS